MRASASVGRAVVTALVGLVAVGCAAPGAVPATARASRTGGVTGVSAPPTAVSTAEGCGVPQRFLGKEVWRLPVGRKVVALTFDAGANADGAPSILRTLADRHVPATFFLTGRFVRAYPRISARIGARYLVGNHTRTHPDLTTLSDRRVRRQIRTAQSLILAATGQDPRRYFRFPYGARSPHLIDVVDRLCYVPFGWTVDTLGWKGTSGGVSAGSVVRRVIGGERPGEIVLMHVGSNPVDRSTLDADALPRVIHRLRRDGYRLVALSEVLPAAP